MVGPSAIGSENGTPSSMTSAPASASACITGTVASSEGSPAVMNGTGQWPCGFVRQRFDGLLVGKLEWSMAIHQSHC